VRIFFSDPRTEATRVFVEAAGACALSLLDPRLHVFFAEVALGEVAVVRAAQDAGVVAVVGAAEGAGHAMVELEESAGRAAAAGFGNERAAFAVSSKDLATHLTWDGAALGFARTLWVTRLAEALLFEFREQQIEPSFENSGEIAAWVAMAHQIAGALDLVFEIGRGSEVYVEAGRGKGLHLGNVAAQCGR
jgi:hypothetical protein